MECSTLQTNPLFIHLFACSMHLSSILNESLKFVENQMQ